MRKITKPQPASSSNPSAIHTSYKILRLLVSYQILSDHYICVLDFVAIWVTARRFVRFSNSDNDSMGKVGARGHWKMD